MYRLAMHPTRSCPHDLRRTLPGTLSRALLVPALLLALALVPSACSHTPAPDGPTSALQPFKRGVQAFQDEDYPRAAKQFELAAALDDRSPVIYYNLGLAYYMLEAFPESIEAYHKALRLDPKFVDAHMNLALAYDRTYDLEQANAQYNEYLTLIRANRLANAQEGGAAGVTAAGAAGPGSGGLGNGGPGTRGPGTGGLGNGGPGNGGAIRPGTAAPGGAGLNALSQPPRGQPGAQRRPSLAAPSGPRAPISELRRLPADDGKPSPPISKDPNSSPSNSWWTQDAPARNR